MNITNSRGKTVQVEITGIVDTMRFLNKKGIAINAAKDIALAQVANFMAQEVQESIIGNRPEVKSVDTGRLANSIEAQPVSKEEYVIQPRNQSYPGTDTTTRDVATILEYGTSKLSPRMHFRNTLARNKPKITEMMDRAVKQVTD